jgi:hypothetical protein
MNMQRSKRDSNEALAILQRLIQWGRVVDDLMTCPIEDFRFSNGQIIFFIDAHLCKEQLLPGFTTVAQRVQEMTTGEKHDLALYLVRLHKSRFASAIRAVTGNVRDGWPEVLVVGDEIEFNLSPKFVREALEIYNE